MAKSVFEAFPVLKTPPTVIHYVGGVLMKINIQKLSSTIALPLIVGVVAGLLTMNAMDAFDQIQQPPLAPPALLFPIVWTILYILMGISAYLIQTKGTDPAAIQKAMNLYYYQLIVNFLWPVFFFNFGWYLLSLAWLILLWILVLQMIRQFAKLSPPAALLNLPYLLWLTFAAYLNAGIWWLNR